MGPVPQLINKWVTHLRHIGTHDQTDTSVSFFAHNYRDLMGTELSTQVQSRFRRGELQDMRLWTASCDWSRFYWQLPTAVRQLWAHLLWLQPGGPQIDHATCFGDAAAPAQANRVQVRLSSRLISSCGAFAALTCSSEPTG